MTKKINLKLIFTILPIMLSVVALCMIFAPAATVKNSETVYSGLKIAFGYSQSSKIGTSTVTTKWFNASANILTYILLIVGAVLAVFAARGKGIARACAAGCFLIAGVLFFCTVALCSPAVSDSIQGDMRDEYVKQAKAAMTLGGGAIAGGIISLIAAVSAILPVFVKKLSA